MTLWERDTISSFIPSRETNYIKLNYEDQFDELSLSDNEPAAKTVVIFDEAGCIPSYELLGLSRLGRDIEALIVVGDKHQLPPYDPSQGRRQPNSFSNRYGNRRPVTRESVTPLQSILDVSALTIDSSKVMLTTQYRVPKDIADMLNTRIYKGTYNTCPSAKVPHRGLFVENVLEDPNPRRKYVNLNEIEKGLEFIHQLSHDPEIRNILVITPVSSSTYFPPPSH